MNEPVSPPPLASRLTVGADDEVGCLAGWSPVERRPDGQAIRWIAGAARARLSAPADATCVGVDLWVDAGWVPAPVTARLIVRDFWVGRQPEVAPLLDVAFRLRPGAWQIVEFPLNVPLLAAADLELEIEITAPEGRLQPHPWHRAAARRLWLRGRRIEPADVAIVVLNWKRADETIACLESLAAADLGGATVLVVDNGSGDGSAEAIRARFPAQQVLALPRNEGYAGGNDAGIAAALEAGARAVLLLNNDTRVAPDFLLALLWVLNGPYAAGAVSSAIFRMDYPELLDIAYLDLFWGHGIVYRRGANALPGEGFAHTREVDAAVGCCMLITAEALRDVGPLDPAYFAYHEEVDWCFRARQAGWRIYYEPLSCVFHAGSRSTAADDRPLRPRRARGEELPSPIPLTWSPIRAYLGGRNTVRFVRRHGTLRQQLYFLASSLYEVPLELTAALAGEYAALKIGAWSYHRALREYCFAGPGLPHDLGGWARAVRRLLGLPIALPRAMLRAYREERLGQVLELMRGLRDGLFERPLPLERLGLRSTDPT